MLINQYQRIPIVCSYHAERSCSNFRYFSRSSAQLVTFVCDSCSSGLLYIICSITYFSKMALRLDHPLTSVIRDVDIQPRKTEDVPGNFIALNMRLVFDDTRSLFPASVYR